DVGDRDACGDGCCRWGSAGRGCSGRGRVCRVVVAGFDGDRFGRQGDAVDGCVGRHREDGHRDRGGRGDISTGGSGRERAGAGRRTGAGSGGFDVATGRVDLAGRGRLGVVILRRTVGGGGGHGVDAGGTRHADGDGAGSGQVAQGGGPHGVVRKGEGKGD